MKAIGFVQNSSSRPFLPCKTFSLLICLMAFSVRDNPHAVSHKIFPIRIGEDVHYVVESAQDHRTFFDVLTTKMLFRTPYPVSSTINCINDEYLIQRMSNHNFYVFKDKLSLDKNAKRKNSLRIVR